MLQLVPLSQHPKDICGNKPHTTSGFCLHIVTFFNRWPDRQRRRKRVRGVRMLPKQLYVFLQNILNCYLRMLYIIGLIGIYWNLISQSCSRERHVFNMQSKARYKTTSGNLHDISRTAAYYAIRCALKGVVCTFEMKKKQQIFLLSTYFNYLTQSGEYIYP